MHSLLIYTFLEASMVMLTECVPTRLSACDYFQKCSAPEIVSCCQDADLNDRVVKYSIVRLSRRMHSPLPHSNV